MCTSSQWKISVLVPQSLGISFSLAISSSAYSVFGMTLYSALFFPAWSNIFGPPSISSWSSLNFPSPQIAFFCLITLHTTACVYRLAFINVGWFLVILTDFGHCCRSSKFANVLGRSFENTLRDIVVRLVLQIIQVFLICVNMQTLPIFAYKKTVFFKIAYLSK